MIAVLPTFTYFICSNKIGKVCNIALFWLSHLLCTNVRSMTVINLNCSAESFDQGRRLMIKVNNEKQQIFEVLKPLEEFEDLTVGHEEYGLVGCMTAFLFNHLPPLKLDDWPPEMTRPCGGQEELLRKLTREAGTEPPIEKGQYSEGVTLLCRWRHVQRLLSLEVFDPSKCCVENAAKSTISVNAR